MHAPVPPPRRSSVSRRRVAFALAAVAFTALPAPVARAGAERLWTAEAERDLNARRKQAIATGAAYIASRQNKGVGSFGDNRAIVAFTALSALALMAQGSSVGRGPYGEHVEKAVDYLVGLVERPQGAAVNLPRGFFYSPQDSNSKMHGQGFATLALASALGGADVARGKRIREALKWAVLCCEQSQTGTGGWGYDPDPAKEHEGSVTVTVAQGLRAARDAGVLVSRDVVQQALSYLRKSQKLLPEGSRDPDDGSFKYSVSTTTSTYALTAAAISSFFLFGEYGTSPDDKERMARGVAYMRRTLRTHLHRNEWLYYGNFYATWAAWQRDGDHPEPRGTAWGSDGASLDIERTEQLWGPLHAKTFERLLRDQKTDGSWSDAERYAFGDLLPTTFAVLTLAIPDEQIPIFQR